MEANEDLKDPCPICEAAVGQPCRDNGEEWGGIHVGRMTGGAPLYIQHTGEYTEAGEGIFRTVESDVDALMANDAYIDELLAEMEAYFEANANE